MIGKQLLLLLNAGVAPASPWVAVGARMGTAGCGGQRAGAEQCFLERKLNQKGLQPFLHLSQAAQKRRSSLGSLLPSEPLRDLYFKRCTD